ncbi:Cocaine esterase [Nocardioides aquaticus]|uniref:Cocaine esterase n=1 Tax=Nocardioides aquaticus TaxID=160826 RepID=A0ABX8EN48_9ACTN|nr:CocE/NonD family hydrolase [Nocardioides aquaticus]QVT80498.1 Cocaine esterase [Nocardioides aquaticus]
MKRALIRTSVVAAALGASALTSPTSAAPAAPAAAAPAAPAAGSIADGVTNDENPGVPVGASWTEHYFRAAQAGSPTTVTLHADVLRPEGLAPTEKTPVILSVGPYFNHAGQTGQETDEVQPSSRFDDLIDGASLMERGYTVVLVDNRGFGASTGCLDWMGAGEQADVRKAVRWSASRPWSTGKVGMYGKSYDAVTGLWGADLDPRGLEAVVAQEPLWNMYPYLYSNDVPRGNQTGTPLAYNSIASLGGTSGDTDRYNQAAAYEQQHPECLARNLRDNVSNTSQRDPYWALRNQAAKATGARTPLFVTQGFTESNTKPEQMEQYLRNHVGPTRGWLGPWEHVRGNEVDPRTGELSQGRSGFFAEVGRFYDRHLKGIRSAKDPAFAIQDNVGQWRAQRTWPVADTTRAVSIGSGRYVDAGPVEAAVRRGDATGTGLSAAQARRVAELQVPPTTVERRDGDVDQQVRSSLGTAAERADAELSVAGLLPTSYQTWSRPVRQETRVTGTPRVTLTTRGEGQVHVTMWDVDPEAQTATLINENVAELGARGRAFDLKGMDWTLAQGHRMAIGVGTITGGSWRPLPSGRVVTVRDATVRLSTQSTADDVATQGAESPWLARYLEDNTIGSGDLPAGTFRVPTP